MQHKKTSFGALTKEHLAMFEKEQRVMDEKIKQAREETAKDTAEDPTEEKVPAAEEEAPIPYKEDATEETANSIVPPPRRNYRWTVVVGLKSQNIQIGGKPLFTDVAAVQVMAPGIVEAKLEARLTLVRNLPHTESDHWLPVYVYAGHQETLDERFVTI